MTLRKQLWIAVAIIMLLALVVSIVVSTLSARNYLAQQLLTKNVDNAASLALSLSQLPKDETTVELQIASQFDTGHYQHIRLVDPTGELILERRNPDPPQGVPTWFVERLGFNVRPGVAHVSDGWSSFGTLIIESQTNYAYEALWEGTLRLTAMFAGGLLIIGLLGSFLLGRLIRPLNQVVEQAEAVGKRRFITTPEPRTWEFRALVRAMNQLTDHVRMMLQEESTRLERLKNHLQHDDVTGLLNRDAFLARFQATLDNRHGGSGGSFVVLRISDLAELNQTIGHAALDQLLARIAGVAEQQASVSSHGAAGRLKGSDIAVFGDGIDDSERFAESLLTAIRADLTAPETPQALTLHLAGTPFHPDDTTGEVLSRVDQALARAELEPGDSVAEEPHAVLPHASQNEWRSAITQALGSHGVQLARFPVIDADHELMHHEAPMRLVLDGESRPAGYFMPWAVRLDLIRKLDDAVLDAALEQLGRTGDCLAINLSVDSLRDTAFRQRLEARLTTEPEIAGRLWLEFPARGALAHPAELRDLCRIARVAGFFVGLEHAGPEAFRSHDLTTFGLHFVKLQASLVQGVQRSTETQALIRGLCTLAHSIGILVIAEGCDHADDVEALLDLGIDGVTGRAVQGVTVESGVRGD
ncbi:MULTISPECIES: LapD/MoxY N-terminal periplasmic domain-containing protein [unclassified Thioalkalivibrio]|uniref:bifunctional diguanylate cyclase/phosphodiesterase n=1 Tax=unclassified Thioalkalivibrio TaxID=2621013 RepID=UPI00035CBE4D|nr:MULTISPECIES: LapD/MoxY N-terminal periplasmic domain-containing protein [unclassified Thioalkalivibrio]